MKKPPKSLSRDDKIELMLTLIAFFMFSFIMGDIINDLFVTPIQNMIKRL